MLSLLLSLLLPLGAFAADKTCKVVGVSDGDTITVLCAEKENVKVRLANVDAPEKKQAFGSAAKQFTSDLVFGKEVTLTGGKKDRYGRTVSSVLLPDGRELGQELVRAGMAWWYKQYSKDASYGALEEEARKAKRGLWSEASPVRPWEFRRKPKSVS